MKTDKMHLWQKPSVRYGGLSFLLLLLLTAILIVTNLLADTLEKKNGWRVDCSFNGVTTQSETTLEVLAQTPYPVHIYALFSKGSEDAPLMELLDRYAAVCPLVTWEQLDPGLNPAILTAFSGTDASVTSDSLIVYCQTTNRRRILEPSEFVSVSMDYETGQVASYGLTYESKITSAISYVTKDRVPRAVILQGHGELDGETLTVFADLLRDNHFDAVYTDLTDADASLAPDDLLCIFSPMRDFNEVELKKISEFAGKGGSMLLTCDYSDPVEKMPNWTALLRSYGFLPKEGIVVASREEPNTYYNNLSIDLIPEMCSTEITLDLLSGGADTLLLAGTRAFETPTETDRNLTVSELLRSGEKAYLKVITSATTNMDREETDETGPFALALQAQRVTAEGYISRAVILGCSTLLTDRQIQTMTDSPQFTVRVADYLVNNKPTDLKIMAKPAIRPGLSARSVTAGSVLLVALPLAVLLMAMIVLVPRRNQ